MWRLACVPRSVEGDDEFGTEGEHVAAAGSHAPPTAAARGAQPDTPVGESHFIADKPMTVKTGSSAMVAMVHGETDGGVVYLYDPISDRGDKRSVWRTARQSA